MADAPTPFSWLAGLTPHTCSPPPSDDDRVSAIALDLGWSPDLSVRQRDDILEEAGWLLEDELSEADAPRVGRPS